MNVLLNFLGILVYFINRYAKRTKKTLPFSIEFWLKDNGPEIAITILLNAMGMILLHLPQTDAALSKLPEWVTMFGKPGMSAILGLGGAWAIYETFKTKVKQTK